MGRDDAHDPGRLPTVGEESVDAEREVERFDADLLRRQRLNSPTGAWRTTAGGRYRTPPLQKKLPLKSRYHFELPFTGSPPVIHPSNVRSVPGDTTWTTSARVLGTPLRTLSRTAATAFPDAATNAPGGVPPAPVHSPCSKT